MQTRNTYRNWAVASAVAAMLAAAAPGAFAQGTDTTTTPPATAPAPTAPAPASTPPTDSTAAAPMSSGTPDSSGSMTPSVASLAVPAGFPTDYSVLNNRVFDSADLEQARARGLSESQIATIVKISKETGLPFHQVSGMVERGQTFPAIATMYNLKLSDIYNHDKEMQQVSDYTALHMAATTLGKGDMMSMPMNSMPMSSSPAPMTPPMTPANPPMASSSSSSTATLDIVDTAMAAKNLTTLVKALQIAGLVETLKGSGPFTVFAPSDKAFSKLPAGALDALEADPAKLKMVLTYHVIPAAISASDAMNMTSPTSPPTVEGATLQVTKGRRGRLKVNDATVTKADIQASNGVIHIIDAVLMPPDATTPPAASTDTTTPPATATPMDATPPTAPATPGTTTPATPTAPAPEPPAATAVPGAPATPGQ